MEKRTVEKLSQFPTFVTRYLEESKLSDRSKEVYIHRLFSVLTYISQISGKPMKELDMKSIEAAFSIDQYYAKKLADGYSKKTIENEYKTFCSMYNRIAGKLHYHSMQDLPEDMVEEQYGMTEEEFNKYQIQVMDALRNLIIDDKRFHHRDALIILLIYEMGLKVSECVGINLEDVQDNYIRISRSGIRKIEIPRNVRVELNRYMKERRELMNDNSDSPGGAPLLTGMHRTRLCNRTIENIIKSAFGKDSEMTPELLRKVSGIYRYKQTGSIEYVALYLGINVYSAEKIVGRIKMGDSYFLPIPS